MRRYKCIVEYDGTSFVGWQRQTNGYSVQEAVEKSLESITQEKIRIHGSGRTDTGVHAKGQVIHFDSNTNLNEYTISSALNHYLKKELISIRNKITDLEKSNNKLRGYVKEMNKIIEDLLKIVDNMKKN